jgi:hypothetical protein
LIFIYLQIAALQEQMSRLSSTSLAERPDAFDHCLAGIARLSSEVKDASSYIPAYDQRTYGDAIKLLQEKLQGVRNELAGGPKKFKFTTKKNTSAISIGDAAEMAQNKRLMGPGNGGYSSGYSSATGSAFAPTPLERLSPGEEKREQELMANVGASPSARKTGTENHDTVADGQGILLSNHHGSWVDLKPSTAQSASSGTVSNVKKSIVNLSDPTANRNSFATLILKNIQDSLIICGRVTGPIHITGVENSVIITACRQFRMHASKKVDVYLHCSSRPIIEDCEAIRFAPLPKHFVMFCPLSNYAFSNQDADD